MLKIIDLSFYANNNYSTIFSAIQSHKETFGYINFLKDRMDVQVVKHINNEKVEIIDGTKYTGFKSQNKFWYIPFKTLRYLKKEKPDIIVSQGLVFPIQLIAMHLIFGKQTIIIAQHHGERPFKSIKRVFQKIADRCINAYLFTAIGNAKPWLENKIIKSQNKCNEILEASTYLSPQNKQQSKAQLNIQGDNNFLWVGRLEKNKDPLTVLDGFEKYLLLNPVAKLFMIYQENPLLEDVKTKIETSSSLKSNVQLIGRIPHEDLSYWFSAADFYLSGSHKEGSGYALIEAMACGCIPIVSDIPSFNKIIKNGKYGFLYEAGNADSLMQTLQQLENVNRNELSAAILEHFKRELSFKAIADNLFEICKNFNSSR